MNYYRFLWKPLSRFVLGSYFCIDFVLVIKNLLKTVFMCILIHFFIQHSVPSVEGTRWIPERNANLRFCFCEYLTSDWLYCAQALSTLISFQNPPFSVSWKRIKTSSSISAFLQRFRPSTLDHRMPDIQPYWLSFTRNGRPSTQMQNRFQKPPL